MIRYPGGKGKLADAIAQAMPPMDGMLLKMHGVERYVEPFVGAGAITRRVLKRADSRIEVWINDIDYGIFCLWHSILHDPGRLRRLIMAYQPNAADFYVFKEAVRGDTTTDTAFRKIALHQISYSGIGPKAGGPIGGREQSNTQYNVGCRWNALLLCKHVTELHGLLRSFRGVEITNDDFSAVINKVDASTLLYCDPPYVEKGEELYEHSMTDIDHARLSRSVKESESRWFMSYDDCPLVRSLYADCYFQSLDNVSTIGVSRTQRRKNSELLITPMRIRF